MSDRAPLSRRARVVIAASGLVVLGVVVATIVVAIRRERAIRDTRAALEPMREAIRKQARELQRWTSADRGQVQTDIWSTYRPWVDAWGREILVEAPGPIHPRGWDLWSNGPNGIDERGEGDDILVGEDVDPW